MSKKSAEALETTNLARMKELKELYDGEPRKPADPVTFDDATWAEFVKDQPKLLGHAFEGFEAAKKGDKSFIDAYFSTKDYTSHSPLLRKYAEAGHVPEGKTLSEQVIEVCGRR